MRTLVYINPMTSHPLPASALLAELAERARNTPSLSVREVLDALRERGFALVLLIFALPMAFPIPYPPGFSSLISLPLFLFTAQLAMGRNSLWLPEKLAQKRLHSPTLVTVVEKAIPWLEKCEKWLQPRHERMTNALAERLIGVFALILTGCIMLPLSMISNTIPAAGISLMSLGLLERDGKAVMLGAIVGLVGLMVTLAAVGTIFLAGAVLIGK